MDNDRRALRPATLSGVAVFDASEVSSFYGEDFLGRCPATSCEIAPPLIEFDAVDALTELHIAVVFGEDCETCYVFRLIFPDGRSYFDSFSDWTNRRTVAGPGTLALFGLGLLGLGLTRRKAH